MGIAAAACLLALTGSRAAAEAYPPGVGLANPALGINASGYVKWGLSSAAPFIDRMKGAFNWSGRLPSRARGGGSVYVLSDPAVFEGTAAPRKIPFGPETVIDLNRLLVAAVFQKKLVSREQNQKINRTPDLFFKLEPGPDGSTRLLGRLRESDAFAPLVEFDRDIGLDLGQLRQQGYLHLTDGDLSVAPDALALDRNGWPVRMPSDRAGRKGEISTIVMWYPKDTANAPESLYAGNFYLLADGKGKLSLVQKGSSPDDVSLRDVAIDGPVAVPFRYQPNGQPVSLTLHETDPGGDGEYLRNIRIVHERHLPMFQAGEISTPEYVAFMADYRTIRWMGAMEGPRNPSFFAGAFEDRTSLDFFTFNLGANRTDRNGIPIDAIIAFANKTGTDPWITVPVNVSDEFARGMAAFIAARLDPDLTLYVELGNENWNGIFPSYRHSVRSARERWSGLALPESRAWAEWAGMRATQVGRMFEEAFEAADPATAWRRLNNVMATHGVWAGSTDLLMQASVWRAQEPEAWIDPADVFESLAVGAYFGGALGSRNSDLVTHWLEAKGQAGAREIVLRHLNAGLDPALPYVRIDASAAAPLGGIRSQKVVRGVAYSPDLMVDVSGLLEHLHPAIRDRINDGEGVTQKRPVMGPDEALHYLRLGEEAGNTVLQMRTHGQADRFETVLAFDGKVPQTLVEMLAEGVIVPRSLSSMQEEADRYFGGQVEKAQKYGLALVAYEGGQHLAAAIWGVYRANLQNKPLVTLLRTLNQGPEITGLYRTWFDAWRAAGGVEFAHYADLGFPSQYGNWGLISYLGQDKAPGVPVYKLDEVRRQNAAGPWWTESRAAAAFLQGLYQTGSGTLTGTMKADVLVGLGGGARLDGGPGNDALFAGGGAGPNTVDAGAGDDVIVISAQADRVAGGPGSDTLKAAMGLAALDLSAMQATGIETVDIRNASRTALSIVPADVQRLTGGGHLQVFAETADRISAPGFQRSGAASGREGYTVTFAGQDEGKAVTFSVTTDIRPAAEARR